MTTPSYEFGSAAEDRTMVMGLRTSQVAIIGAGLTVAVAVVRASGGTASSFAMALGLVAACGVASLAPIGGRTLDEWIPVAARWSMGSCGGRRRILSPVPLLGHDSDGGLAQQPPPSLAGVSLLELDAGGGDRAIGVIHDRRASTYSAVLAVRGHSFQLADTPDRTRRLASWGGVLAGLARAGTPVHRVQWIERTVPDNTDAMGRYLTQHREVDRGHPALSSYLDLVDRAESATPAHEALLVLTVSAHLARHAIRQAGGGADGAMQVLLREIDTLQRQLAAADVTVEGILTPRLLAGALRTAFDPHAPAGLARRATAGGGEAGTNPGNAWPLATETTWRAYRSADAWHATYWIAQWPRTPVGSDFLTPLLLGTQVMRTVSVTLEPVSPMRAHREVEHAIVKGQADEELRARAGFAATARRRRAQETAARREQELADGHADYRLAGYVTVTASAIDELEAACSEVEQAAQQSFLELRRLYGQQDIAFTWTLPLGRGLR